MMCRCGVKLKPEMDKMKNVFKLQKEGKLTSKPFFRCLTRQSEVKRSAGVEKGELVCEGESSFSTSVFATLQSRETLKSERIFLKYFSMR